VDDGQQLLRTETQFALINKRLPIGRLLGREGCLENLTDPGNLVSLDNDPGDCGA
jgi:hypothetical protein